MNTMTWEQIKKDWGGLQKRHRMEIAQAVARYCIGHSPKDVSERLGYSMTWTRDQLDYAGVGAAIGGGPESSPPLTGSTDNVAKELPRLVKEFAPAAVVKISDDGHGHQSVKSVEGDDAEEFEPYLEHYIEQGHSPAAATRLAKAEWAGEAAVEAGVIKETVDKKNKRVNQILFPNDKKDSFELSLKMHMANVRRAATFLDDAKMTFLKKESTAAEVASTHAKWLEQVERIRNLHPTFA